MVAKRRVNKKSVTLPITPDLITRELDFEEKRRMQESYKEYQLSEEERLAIIEKYGPPVAPLGSYHSITIPMKKKKGGGAA